jgi:hypothetical protein
VPSTGSTVGWGGGTGDGVSDAAASAAGGNVTVMTSAGDVGAFVPFDRAAQALLRRREMKIKEKILEITGWVYLAGTEKTFSGPYSNRRSARCRSRSDVTLKKSVTLWGVLYSEFVLRTMMAF